MKVFEIPEGAKNAKGRAIQNLLNIEPDDKVQAFIRVKKLTTDTEFINSHYLLFCTKKGVIKRPCWRPIPVLVKRCERYYIA